MKVHNWMAVGAAVPAVTVVCLARPAEGQSLASGVPCSALGDAIIANTGQLFSDANSIIDGNVQVATTLVQNNGVINGTVTQNRPARLPVIQPPAGATNLGNFNLGSGQSRNLPAGNYVASSFTLDSRATLTVSGGEVHVWITGALTLGGTENASGVPSNLQFLVTGTSDVNINGGGAPTVPALIYAPNARVNVFSRVFGVVVGSTVTVNSGGGVVDFDTTAQCPVSTPPPGACLATSSVAALVSGQNVTAYVPLSDFDAFGTTGIRVVPIEGTGPHTTVPTPNLVNSCAASGPAGQVVCTANNTDVYIVRGTTLAKTLTSAATGTQAFSGGSVQNAGVTMDVAHGQAIVSVGLAGGGANGVGGLQVLDLASDTFLPAPPLALGTRTSEGVLVDPVRNLVLSPNEDDVFALARPSSGSVFLFDPPGVAFPHEFDSAAEDCSTGLALSTVEFASGEILFTDLTQATFSGNTWSAPNAVRTFSEFGQLLSGVSAIAVAPTSHLGIVTDESNGSAFGVIQLPASAAPLNLTDWVVATMPNDPSGNPWNSAVDPHGLTLYQSPSSGKTFAVLANIDNTFLAVVDIAGVLAGPRNGHQSTANLSSFVRFLAI